MDKLYSIFKGQTYKKDLGVIKDLYNKKNYINNKTVFKAIINCIEILFNYLKRDIKDNTNIQDGLINCNFSIFKNGDNAIYYNACEFINYYLKDLIIDICNDSIILLEGEKDENIKLMYSLIKKYPECLKVEYSYNCIETGKPYDTEKGDYIKIIRDTTNIQKELNKNSKLLCEPLMINYRDLEIEDLEFLKKCKYLHNVLDNIEFRLEEIFGANLIYSDTKLPIYIS